MPIEITLTIDAQSTESTPMSLYIIGIILSAAMLHAIWNTIVKTSVDRTITLGLLAFGHVVPAAILVAVLPLPSAESFIYIILSTFIHFSYFFMLGRAYQHGDLSTVYPIARGIVPALVSLWAMLLLGENLPVTVWLGIGCIAIGIPLSNFSTMRLGLNKTALGLALGTGLSIALYSLTDGVGVRLSGNTLSYWAWGSFLHLFVAGFIGWHKRRTLATLSSGILLLGFLGGLVSMSAYGLVLYAKNFAPLGAVSALRETSVIFATLIGCLILKEGNLGLRLAAAGLMVFGITLIALNT